jgi:hypothetical protein
MHRFPNEILLYIFTMACSDDGVTGCSLSLTSRHIRDVSQSVRFYSVAVVGSARMKALTSLLVALEQNRRRSPQVLHLLVSLGANHPSSEDNMHNTGPRADLTEHCAASGSRGFLERMHERESEGADAFIPLIKLVAPTLQTLFVDGVAMERVASALSLPRLLALSVTAGVPYRLCTPNLRRLHLAACSYLLLTSQWSADVWDHIARSSAHASLTELAIYGVENGNPADYLRVQLDLPLAGGESETADGLKARRLAAQLPKLRHVWIEPRSLSGAVGSDRSRMRGAMLAALHELERQSWQINGVGSLAVLPGRDGRYDFCHLLADWLNYVSGGGGPWQCHTPQHWR